MADPKALSIPEFQQKIRPSQEQNYKSKLWRCKNCMDFW